MKKSYSYAVIAAVFNLGLFFVKLYIGLSSGSVAIYADSMNNLLDSGVCIAAFVGLMLILRKRSDNYPFGMGKVEDLLSFIISLAISVSGLYFGYTSFERIMYPMPVWFSVRYAVIIAVTAIVKLVLALFLRRNKNGDVIIKGIAADSLMDFFITVCSFVSFTLSSRVGYSVDGIAGMIISIVMTVQGIKALIISCSALIGKNESDVCEKAKIIIEKETSVKKIMSIACHKYGQNRIFTATVETNCETAEEIKESEKRIGESIASEFNAEIYLSFRGAE